MRLICQSISSMMLFSGALLSCTPAEKQPDVVSGVVIDASMNNISVLSASGDTTSISTMDTDPTKVPGVLLEDSVKVFFSKVNAEGVEYLKADSLVVTSHSPYYFISGSWNQPIAGQEGLEGFVLNQNGTASSINMATLEVYGWNMPNTKTLVLQTKSIGNKQTIEADVTYDITKIDANSLVLSQDGNVVWSLSRAK